MQKRFIFAFLLMGFSFSTTQALMARELLVNFTGNELSIGLVLGNWLILEALGSGLLGKLAGRRRSGPLAYAALQVALALVLPLSLYAAVTVRRIIGVTPGEGISPGPILYSSFLILVPLGLVDGAMFAFGCQAYSQLATAREPSASTVYILEAIGGIAGGLVFTYLFIPYLQSIQVVLVLSLLNLASAVSILVTATCSRRSLLPDRRVTNPARAVLNLPSLGGVVILLLLTVFLLLPTNAGRLHRWIIRQQWLPHQVVGYRNSIYGNLVVVQAWEQYTFFTNGLPVLTAPTPDTVSAEEIAHLPLLFRDPPHEVLVVGGGVGGVLNELLKYPVERIDYAEPDPALIEIVRQFPTPLTRSELADPRVRVHHLDGRLLVRQMSSQSPGQYDLVVINLPYPSTLQLNRMYTGDFFRLARSVLADEGLLVITSPGAPAYMSPGLRNLNASLYDALSQAFPQVYAIPGETNLWLASPGLELGSIPAPVLEERWGKRDVPTQAVNAAHIRYKLHPNRLSWFWDSLQVSEPVKRNEDLRPSGLLYGLLYWSEQFSPGLSGYLTALTHLNLAHLLVLLLALVFLVAVIRARRLSRTTVPFAIGATGFAGMTFDLLVIFAFQTLYGYVYQQIGLLITAFMAGLSLGGWWTASWLRATTQPIPLRSALVRLEVALFLYTGIFPLALVLLHNLAPAPVGSAWVRIALLGLNAVAGLLVGLEFPLANALLLGDTSEVGETAGLLYAADLVGACLGALGVSLALLPALGILETCAFLVALKLGSLILVATMRGVSVH